MELKDFIVNFAEQFDDIEDVELTVDTRFRDIEGYTSLVALMIITMEAHTIKIVFKSK
jgi:hypothetical protein